MTWPVTHRLTKEPEYTIWIDMRRRCNDPRRDSYKNYGARGIRVCERWMTDFAAFYSDMGPRPSDKHTIERLNSKGHYEPENCVWATWIKQANNRSNNRIVEYLGEPMTLASAIRASKSPAGKNNVMKRLAAGWTLMDALTKPLDRSRVRSGETHV